MEIKFDKALLWLLPYLYLVSVMYYWGYWGTFGIDAYSYYDIADLVKGIIAHIGSTIYSLGGTIIILVVIDKLEDAIKQMVEEKFPKHVKILVYLVTAVFVIIAAFYLYSFMLMNGSSEVPTEDKMHEMKIIRILSHVLPMTLTIIICLLFAKAGKINDFTYTFCSILFAISMPIRAFVNGKDDARVIQQNKAFDYVIADSIASPHKTIYKSLGKTGAYHILMTLDNSKYIIINPDKLSPLVIEKFSLLDTATIRPFHAHQKELADLIPKKHPTKPLVPASPSQQPMQPK